MTGIPQRGDAITAGAQHHGPPSHENSPGLIAMSSPTPPYHRISAAMRERIVNDHDPQDVPVPSDSELAESFTTSCITVRKAMER